MSSAAAVGILFISFQSCIALFATSDPRSRYYPHPRRPRGGPPVRRPQVAHPPVRPPQVAHPISEYTRLNDRHYVNVKDCVRPTAQRIPNGSVTLFGGPPRTLWQTERQPEKDLPDVVTNMRKKWGELNSEIEMKYMSDEEALAFVEANFDKSIVDAFKGFPLGVMRADFWRYLVVYTYGGVYADVDVEPWKAVRHWLISEENWQRCSMVIGQENGVDLSQFAFAATPKHPALKAVIDLIVARYQEGIKLNFTHFVHYHTGPAVFTAGIHMYAGRTSTSCETGPGGSWVTAGTQICVLQQAVLNDMITNHAASVNETFTNVLGSWRDERDHMLDPNKRVSRQSPNVPCRCDQ